jgi:hypothetical protein
MIRSTSSSNGPAKHTLAENSAQPAINMETVITGLTRHAATGFGMIAKTPTSMAFDWNIRYRHARGNLVKNR